MLRTDYLRALESLCPAEEVSVIEPDTSGYLKLEGDSYVIVESGEGPKVFEGTAYFLRWGLTWIEPVTGNPSRDVKTLHAMVSQRYKSYFDYKGSIEFLGNTNKVQNFLRFVW